jgi:hypothetical protein
MIGYHNIYLQLTVIMTSSYNERLPYHLLTIDGYYGIFLQWLITITFIYNGRLQ